MNKYELAVVISAKAEEDVRSDTLSKAKALIERFGGVIGKVDAWGKRRLAYEIDKMNEGYYYFIKFEAEPVVPAEIESRVRILDNVIRYLLVKDDGVEIVEEEVEEDDSEEEERDDSENE